ncbi:hypothetical protein niasHS_006068 [Heterodera schachtii]|uniref:DUF4773 domain-containing protein n=1 Tax=Heterodera schachtii TaxID=97005 RepID=A0ABD2JW05_HETSC
MHYYWLIIVSSAYLFGFLFADSINHFGQFEFSPNKLARLRNDIRSSKSNSLQTFAKKINGYCAVQQQKMAKYYVESANLSTETGCLCANQSCSCCADLNIQFRIVRVHENICLNFAYLAQSVSIQLAIIVDGRTVFQITVSAINPPPICLPLFVGELCFEFYNLNVSHNLFSGCALFDMVLLHQKVIHEKLGCFKIPVPIASENEH